MSLIDTYREQYEFNRSRTLGLLDRIEKMPDPQAVLSWRPDPGRAHLAWQLMHIGVAEELFAVERLAKKEGRFQELWDRFKGGSTPDDDIPTVRQIREVLAAGREDLLATLSEQDEAALDEVVWEAPDGRRLTLRVTLQILGWHEAHHQGQSHITLNLYNASLAG